MKQSARERQRRATERQKAGEEDRFQRRCTDLTEQGVASLTERRERECLRKVNRFRTKRDAEKYKYLMRRRWSKPEAFFLMPYEFPFCRFWHLGHPMAATIWLMPRAIQNQSLHEAS